MQDMIKAYETSRAGIQRRIRELNRALENDAMMHRDRELTKRRRDLLLYESFEMLHIIEELKDRCA